MTRRHEQHFAGYYARQQTGERFVAGGMPRSLGDTARKRDAQTLTDIVAVPEKDVQSAVLEALAFHPRVAFFWRQNTGGMQDENVNKVRFAFKGCSDILGMLRDGRFLAIEVKRPGGPGPTPEQRAFLAKVRVGGGVGFVVRSLDDLKEGLEAA